MTDEELVNGYVSHVDRIPAFPPEKSREEVEAAIAAIDAASLEDEFFWAWEEVTDLIGSDPERAWRILLAALARCTPHHEYIIGAGPLESF